MTKDRLTYWDYVKAAFWRGPRAPLLGRMPVNQMALLAVGLLGLVNPGFWMAGAAAEVGYLALLSSNQRFQKLVQGEHLLGAQQQFDHKVQQTVNALPAEARDRFRRLLAECELILGIPSDLDSGQPGALADLRSGGLNQLLALFLRLLTSQQSILANLAQVDRGSLEQELARLRERLTTAEKDSALARSLAATLDIQTKRLANLQRAQDSLAVMDAELERIERQVRLIREESAVGASPEALSARLDAVTGTLAETSRWMDQNADLLGGLAADVLGSETRTLPRLDGAESDNPPTASPPPPRRGQRQRN
ncbi:MAG TPA: hypothetical protein PLL30_15045 [Candidatus Krumholzibacteria bacterium]|nr:hypothetical protein [Candidatus Krumholzibacteria bacterium]HPD73086.1 hypothetical protein [Candidatus Krumholzibacteria bacterium]HRY41886.1 hypothetical protein [Candidatus Krumholzibacteria bacterium]